MGSHQQSKAPGQTQVWGRHAQQWGQVGPPLKPSVDDARLMLSALQGVLESSSDKCLIGVLGVTPELVQLPWPSHVTLMAFDHSMDMINRIWEPHPTIRSYAQSADWRLLPMAAGSLDAAVGDGSLNALPDISIYPAMLCEMHRVLIDEGLLVIRCFIRPDVREHTPALVASAMRGQMANFHVLKWRLAMSLVSEPGGSVTVDEIWQAFQTLFPSRTALHESTGWPHEQINTIDAYRNMPTRYTFPTLTELRKLVEPWFNVTSVEYPRYALADRCPTLTLLKSPPGVRHDRC